MANKEFNMSEIQRVFANIEEKFRGKTWANVAEEDGLFSGLENAKRNVMNAIKEEHSGSSVMPTTVVVPSNSAPTVRINGYPVNDWLASKKPLRINGKTVQEWLAIKKDKRPIFNGPATAPSPGIKENNSPSLLVTGFDTHRYDLDDFVLLASLGGPVRDIFKPAGKNFLFVEMVGADAAQRVKDMFADSELKVAGRKILFDVSVRSSAQRYKGTASGAASPSAKTKTQKKRMGGGSMINNASNKVDNLGYTAANKTKNAAAAAFTEARNSTKNAAGAARNATKKVANVTIGVGSNMVKYGTEKLSSMQPATTDPFATVKATAKGINEGIKAKANAKTKNMTRRNRK